MLKPLQIIQLKLFLKRNPEILRLYYKNEYSLITFYRNDGVRRKIITFKEPHGLENTVHLVDDLVNVKR